MARRKWIPSKRRIKAAYSKYDEEAQLCYTAEHYGDAVSQAYFKNKEEVHYFLSRVCASPRFKRRWKGKKLRLIWMNRHTKEARGGHIKSYPFIMTPDSPFGRGVHLLLHEVAHTLADGGHGPRFLKVLLSLMEEFEGRDFAKNLRARLKDVKAL